MQAPLLVKRKERKQSWKLSADCVSTLTLFSCKILSSHFIIALWPSLSKFSSFWLKNTLDFHFIWQSLLYVKHALSSQIVYTVFLCDQVADVRKYQQWDHYGRGSSCIIRTSSDESQFATSIVELHFLHLLHCYINSSSYICYIVQSTLSDYSRITYSTAMASTMQ